MAQIVDPKLIKELMEGEEKRLQEQTPKSAALYERAARGRYGAAGPIDGALPAPSLRDGVAAERPPDPISLFQLPLWPFP